MIILTPVVHHAMAHPPWERFRRPVVAMTVAFTVCYMAVAVAGAFLFRVPKVSHFPNPNPNPKSNPKSNPDWMQGEMSLDLEPNSKLNTAAVLFYVLQLMMTYIIIFFTLVDALEV